MQNYKYNTFDVPLIDGVMEKEFKMGAFLPFNYAKTTRDRADKICHFYLDDYQFERVWNRREAYLEMLKQFAFVLQPDFSLFVDMPFPVQLYNHYRKQTLSEEWENSGIKVIPAVCWSDARSFDFCFTGLPENSVISVSSVGTQLDKQSKQGFLRGYEEMLKRLNPAKILFYGKIPEEIESENIIRIPSYGEQLRERMKI